MTISQDDLGLISEVVRTTIKETLRDFISWDGTIPTDIPTTNAEEFIGVDPVTGGITLLSVENFRSLLEKKYSEAPILADIIRDYPTYFLWKGKHNTPQVNKEIDKNNGQSEAFLVAMITSGTTRDDRFFTIFDSGIGTHTIVRHKNTYVAFQGVGSESYSTQEIIDIVKENIQYLVDDQIGKWDAAHIEHPLWG